MIGEGLFIHIGPFSLFWSKFVAVVFGCVVVLSVCLSVYLSYGSIQKASLEDCSRVGWGERGLKGNKGRDSIRQKAGLLERFQST